MKKKQTKIDSANKILIILATLIIFNILFLTNLYIKKSLDDILFVVLLLIITLFAMITHIYIKKMI
jgi:hypothetical protein